MKADFDVRGGRIIGVIVGNRAAAGYIAEHLSPAILIIQVFLEVVVMIIGIEQIPFFRIGYRGSV